MTKPLSPAAHAVRNAFNKGWGPNLPAALRAAADQVITPNRLAALETRRSAEARLLLVWCRDRFYAIADELSP
jgi:hypothetical protein